MQKCGERRGLSVVADERCATPWPHVGLRGPTERTSLLSMLRHKINPGLEVRLLQPEHAAELFALVDANRAALREWLPWVDATCKVGDSEKFIAEALRERTATRAYQAGIWSMGALVGGIGGWPFPVGGSCRRRRGRV